MGLSVILFVDEAEKTEKIHKDVFLCKYPRNVNNGEIIMRKGSRYPKRIDAAHNLN